ARARPGAREPKPNGVPAEVAPEMAESIAEAALNASAAVSEGAELEEEGATDTIEIAAVSEPADADAAEEQAPEPAEATAAVEVEPEAPVAEETSEASEEVAETTSDEAAEATEETSAEEATEVASEEAPEALEAAEPVTEDTAEAVGAEEQPSDTPTETTATDEAAPETAAEVVEEVSEAVQDEAPEEAPQPLAAEEAAHVEPMAAAGHDDSEVGDPRTLPLAMLPEVGMSDTERLTAMEQEMAALVASGDPGAALAQVQSAFEAPRSIRQLGENLMLCITYAKLALRAEAQDKAREALERAFDLDPRDRVVLTEYGELLSQTQADPDLMLQVHRNLLLHHRNALSSAELGTVYRRIGQGYLGQDDQERARTCFERALDTNSGDRLALDLLLQTVEAQGDFEQVIAVRQRLLDQMRDPEGRAMLKVAIGDDYMERLGDAEKAIEAYEDALRDHVSIDALNKLARIAIQQEDWSRVANIYSQLGDILTAPDEKATAWLQAGNTYRHRLGNHAAAAQAFEQSLDIDASQLPAFKEITQIHAETQQWGALQGAYERMIARAEAVAEPDAKLIAVLNRNLGEVLRLHLHDHARAITAYEKAAEQAPDDVQLTEILADLYAKADDSDSASLDAAIAYNRKLMAKQPNNHELLARVARLHLRKQDFDQAYCIFRVLALLGKADDQALAFVQQHTPQTIKPLQEAITPQFYVQRLLGDQYDVVLAEVFDICRESITKLLAHDLQHYNLKNRDRIDRKDDLMFVKVYRRVATQLTYPEAPPVYYKKDDFKGMINGSLYPPGFLVGSHL
ncbi:MAG: hypothetical protein AAFX99_29025, partial [Myxococcota bacterium]